MVANFWNQEFAATVGQSTTEGWKRDAEAYGLEFFLQRRLF
jgi:hypothetical protein